MPDDDIPKETRIAQAGVGKDAKLGLAVLRSSSAIWFRLSGVCRNSGFIPDAVKSVPGLGARESTTRMLAEFRRSGGVSAKGMTTIIQVEYRTTLLSIREEILQSLGRPILSVLGSKAARVLDLADREIGVVVIGHGAPWSERAELVAHFKSALPKAPVVVLLRVHDEPITLAEYNCRADNPTEWVRTVSSALHGIA